MPNEPAFPSLHYKAVEFGEEGRAYASFEGISTLDYFAAKAMQGMLASGREFHIPGNSLSVEIKAYDLANAMLKEREKYVK